MGSTSRRRKASTRSSRRRGRSKVSKGLDAVLIDYLQLLTSPRSKGERRTGRRRWRRSRDTASSWLAPGLRGVRAFQLNNDASRDGIPKIHHLKGIGRHSPGRRRGVHGLPPDKEEHDAAKSAFNNLRNMQRTVEQENLFRKSKSRSQSASWICRRAEAPKRHRRPSCSRAVHAIP